MQIKSPEIRLQKFIADCGYTSRRKAEELIANGLVKVNGKYTDVLGTKVNPDTDVVEVDGQLLDLKAVEKIYAVLHKPRSVMTTLHDPEGRATVLDFIPQVSERIYPVGRLDYLSEGLLILTNDGGLANTIMHPSSNIVKVYEVKVFGIVDESMLRDLKKGAQLEEGYVRPLSVRIIKRLPNKTWLEIRLSDGKNREIRRLCEHVGMTVDKLKRIAIGGLSVEGLAPGKYMLMNKKQLLKEIGIDSLGRKNSGTTDLFVSSKKTVSHKRMRNAEGPKANDDGFKKFRRETYFETLRTLKEAKESKEATPVKKA